MVKGEPYAYLLTFTKTDGTMLTSRYYSWYLPWSPTVKHMTPVQLVTEMIHLFSKLSSILTAASLPILPILLSQTPHQGIPGYRVDRIQQLLGIIFVVKYSAFQINRYLIYSRVGTSIVAETGRVRTWGAPCKTFRISDAVFPTKSGKFERDGQLTAVQQTSPIEHCSP